MKYFKENPFNMKKYLKKKRYQDNMLKLFNN